jgi:hypothetical protein
MKKVWVSALSKNEESIQKVMESIKTYGMSPAGHFWQDDAENMAWLGARDELLAKDVALWLIVGGPEDFGRDSVRYALSLLAIDIQAQRGIGFPIVVASTDPDLKAELLPTPLKGAEVLSLSSPTLGVKIVSLANMPPKKLKAEYRLGVYAIPRVGTWLEVGPAPGQVWKGAMFGVSGGDIAAHGVGGAGVIPERCVLEYAMKGMKLQLGEKEYTAWSAQNELDESLSYYVSIRDYPSSILFGPLPSGDDAEVFVLALK